VPGDQQCQLARSEGQRHTGLLSKEQSCQERKRHSSMQALETELHRARVGFALRACHVNDPASGPIARLRATTVPST
jgi:hypothetical protein